MFENNVPAMSRPVPEELAIMRMTESELRQAIREAWQQGTAELLKMSRLLHYFHQRGFDVSEFQQTLGASYESYLKVGSGEYNYELFMAYMDTSLWNTLKKLPLADQKLLATKGSVEMVEFREDGTADMRAIPLREIALDPKKKAQVFDARGGITKIRKKAEQVIYLKDGNRKPPPSMLDIVEGYAIDRKKLKATWVKSSTAPMEMPLSVIRALFGAFEK